MTLITHIHKVVVNLDIHTMVWFSIMKIPLVPRLYMDTKPLGLVSMDRLVVNFHARSKQ